uniref:Serine/threonine-protein kinase greatwall n=1 Tax=Macrostomum lignano TaxID=282301 RepID=A0A1I8J276_9PLAT
MSGLSASDNQDSLLDETSKLSAASATAANCHGDSGVENECTVIKSQPAVASCHDEDDGEEPSRPQPNLRVPAAQLVGAKPASYRQLEDSVWPGAFRQRMAIPYAEYAEHCPLGRINWSEWALAEREDTIRKGHHAVCPLFRSRKTGTLYRCKIVTCSRVHFNLTALGFKAGEFERQIRACLTERQLLFAFDHPFVRSGLGFFTDAYCNFGEDAIRAIAAQTVLALEYLHCVGCVHRDVQSANLLVDARGYVKLTDFAITAVLPEDGQPLRDVTCFRYYAAPEYFNGKGARL